MPERTVEGVRYTVEHGYYDADSNKHAKSDIEFLLSEIDRLNVIVAAADEFITAEFAPPSSDQRERASEALHKLYDLLP
jgi:hypothetical protein